VSDIEHRAILKRRAIGFAAGIGVTLLLIGGYLFFLQVVRGVEFRTRASSVARREIPIPAQRGKIFDRTHRQVLVTNRPAFSVNLVPGEVPAGEMPDLLERLAGQLGVEPHQLAERVPRHMRHLFRSVELKRNVEFATIATLAEQIDSFPGVAWHSEPARDYGEIGSLAHVTGYVGDVTREELQVLFNEGYTSGDVVGKSGVEKRYESVLRGRDGVGHRTVDVHERAVTDVWQTAVAPQPGSDIVLTIDSRLQRVVEEALGPRIGSAVVLRPTTGEILAMVSYPWFDPQTFIGDGGPAAFSVAASDPAFPFVNRAIRAAYAPASVFKILMMTGLLEERVYSPTRSVLCRGRFAYGDRIFKDWIKEGHGRIDMDDALAQSCDIYFYQAGLALGINNIADYSVGFGLGAPTGIDLPGEAAGSVPTPAWKLRERGTGWVGGDTVNLSIGQGYITVTPLQIANLIAMVANNGEIYRPHVVKEIRDGETGEILEQTERELLHRSEISDATFARVRDAMRLVITDGTAQPVITTDAVAVAGKTGTGEVGFDDRWHSWFAAYGPYGAADRSEQIVVVTMVEAVNEWEWWAAKAANLIFHAAFTGQSVTETVEYLKPWYGDAVFNPLRPEEEEEAEEEEEPASDGGESGGDSG
jgi:penicillin-binding protein 2